MTDEQQYREALSTLRALPEDAVEAQGTVHVQRAIEDLEYVVENEFGLVTAAFGASTSSDSDGQEFRCGECQHIRSVTKPGIAGGSSAILKCLGDCTGKTLHTEADR